MLELKLKRMIGVVVSGAILLVRSRRHTLSSTMQSAGVKKAKASSPFCPHNPYLPALTMNHTEIKLYGQRLTSHKQRALESPEKDWNHERFRSLEEHATFDEICIGGACGKDTSKIMAGLEFLKENCTVYSIGGNNQWEFELDILKQTPCEVHTFDCTGNETRFHVPENDGRLHFHYECLHGGTAGAEKPSPLFLTLKEMTDKYNHKQIDLFKMDIEGYEFGVFDYMKSLEEKEKTFLPMQMLVELHYRTIKALYKYTRRDWKHETDIVDVAQLLYDLGYVVAKRDDNRSCRHCSELTLIRAYCEQN